MDPLTPTVFRFLLLTSLLPAVTSLPDFLRERRSDLPFDDLESVGLTENHSQNLMRTLKQVHFLLQVAKNLREKLDAAERKKLESTKRFGPRNRFLRVGRAGSTDNAYSPADESDSDGESKYHSDLRRTLHVLKALAQSRPSDTSPSFDDGSEFQAMARGGNEAETSIGEKGEFLGVDERAQPKSHFLRTGRAFPKSSFVRIGRGPLISHFVRIGRASPTSHFVRIGRRPPRNHFIRIGKRSARSISDEEDEAGEETDNSDNNYISDEERDQYDPASLTFDRQTRGDEESDEEDGERYLQDLLRLQRRSAFVRIGRLPVSVYIQRQRMFSGRDGRPPSLENLSRRRSPGFRFTNAGIVRAGKRASDLN